jgi:hypothetical protein
MLSFGPTWEMAHPVAFDSMQLKDAEKNYPVHEKELLAIIRALKKWQTDLLGMEFIVYTDHRTLENFNTQKDLSHCQLRWQVFMSQYDFSIVYIPGETNTVADALSRLPLNVFLDEHQSSLQPHAIWSSPRAVSSVLSLSADTSILEDIIAGYQSDNFCTKLISAGSNMKGI